ncbi:MAG: hypothetical protein OQL06_10195 [Gammaproteobacteria bacterium]|nr:hypothetical protein [Gammaproteobacteria bacterium]
MKKNSIQIKCSTTVKNILCEALRNYAFITYSGKNSKNDCLSRETLLNSIHFIEHEFQQNNHHIILNSSIYNDFEAAINHHYDRIHHELNANVSQQRKLMLNILNGVSIDDHELDTALHEDNII